MKSPFTLLADAVTSRPFAVAGVFAFIFIVALFGISSSLIFKQAHSLPNRETLTKTKDL